MPPAPAPEFVEVRCLGCGETLEVEPGLTEFACPDCGTQQALPPELMPPPPPRPRRALPIPGRGPPAAAAAVPVHVPAPARMPCGGCAALLSVPAGLGRFACPLCAVELVVDGGRLRPYLATPTAVAVSVVAPPPAGVTLTSPSPRQRPEVQPERYDHPIRPEQTPVKCPSRSVHREDTCSSFRTDTRTAIHNMLGQKEALNNSVNRDYLRIEAPNKTTVRPNTRKTSLQADTESISVEKGQPDPTIQACVPHTEAPPFRYLVRRDYIQGNDSVVDIASHGHQRNNISISMEQDKTEDVTQSVNVKQAQIEHQNLKRKRSIKSAKGNQKRKKVFAGPPNEGLHLRRSKRLTKTTEHPISDQPVQSSGASPNESSSDPPDIDGIINNLCPSPLPSHQMPLARTSELHIVDAATLPSSSDHTTSQAEQFPHCYSQFYPPEVRGMNKSDKSDEQVQQQSPEVRLVEQVEAHGNHHLLGSDGKSSGKRKGRRRGCPTRLIEPRREVDRPVLIPNILGNWDVNPPCSKVAYTMTLLIKQKYPGSTYLPVSQHGNVPPNGEVVHHWQQYPPEMRASILNEFLQRYKWAPGHEAECLKLFDRRAAKHFTGMLNLEKRRAKAELAAVLKAKEAPCARRSNIHAERDDEDASEEPRDQQTVEGSEENDPLQWKPFPPAWMYPNWWNKLCEYWAKDEIMEMSIQNRKNRYVGGFAHHTTGSRSLARHRQLMVIENGGKPVSELDVFNRTHKLKSGSGEFVSEKAKRTVEGFRKRMEEAGDKQIDPHIAWLQQVGGRNRGRYYGLTGAIDKAKIDEIAKSIPGYCKRDQRQKFTQEQVQQMINMALQGLNETWDKKFKSLERSVVPLLGVDPEHAPGSSAAGGSGQEDRSRHQVRFAAAWSKSSICKP